MKKKFCTHCGKTHYPFILCYEKTNFDNLIAKRKEEEWDNMWRYGDTEPDQKLQRFIPHHNRNLSRLGIPEPPICPHDNKVMQWDKRQFEWVCAYKHCPRKKREEKLRKKAEKEWKDKWGW